MDSQEIRTDEMAQRGSSTRSGGNRAMQKNRNTLSLSASYYCCSTICCALSVLLVVVAYDLVLLEARRVFGVRLVLLLMFLVFGWCSFVIDVGVG